MSGAIGGSVRHQHSSDGRYVWCVAVQEAVAAWQLELPAAAATNTNWFARACDVHGTVSRIAVVEPHSPSQHNSNDATTSCANVGCSWS